MPLSAHRLHSSVERRIERERDIKEGQIRERETDREKRERGAKETQSYNFCEGGSDN